METVDDVLDGLESGVQHAFQAGIDRVNQGAKTLSHEIKDWRIMPHPFTYAVSAIPLTLLCEAGNSLALKPEVH